MLLKTTMPYREVRIPILIIACVLLALIWPVTAQAEKDDANSAPFGHIWGTSTNEVKALGVELTKIDNLDYGHSYAAAKLPKVLSDMQTAWLSFGFGDQLWRITAVGRPNENDPSGAHALNRYDELSAVLTEKYGKGKTHHSIDKYYKAENFIFGIKSGRNFWYTNWENEKIKITCGIVGEGTSQSNWRLIFEHKGFNREFEKSKKKREKSTL